MMLFDPDNLTLTAIETVGIISLLTVIYYLHKWRGVLPGPVGVPYLGLYPFLKDETVHIQLAEYGKKYGDVFSFTYTGRHFIHLGSVKAVRDLHVNKSEYFSGRLTAFNVLTYMLEDGVTMSNGEMWKAHRKFFIQKFREYGLSSLRDNFSTPIYDSLEATIKTLADTKSKPINILQLLTERCTVTLRRMIFGEKGISNEDVEELNALYLASLEGMCGAKIIVVGPVGRLLFKLSPVSRKAFKEHDDIRKILHACIKRIESSMNEDHPTCIIEEFYKERNERRKQNDPVWKTYTDFSLVSSLVQFVGDGIGGIAAFIAGFLNVLLEHPDEQEKIYEEMMEVVGPSRQPTLEDKARLPYMNAFLNEVFRTFSFVPLFPSLECSRETTYRGYRIPKGAITLENFWAIHRNPETFEHPDKFDPSRFIATPGKPKSELPMAFGMGKRACSGEVFVMAQSFLFVSTIIKNFRIVSSNDPKNSTANFILTGKLELCFLPRDDKYPSRV